MRDHEDTCQLTDYQMNLVEAVECLHSDDLIAIRHDVMNGGHNLRAAIEHLLLSDYARLREAVAQIKSDMKAD